MMFEKKGNEKVQVAKKYVCLLFFLVLGNVLIAFGVCAFVVPNRFMMGGTTGIALALQHIVPLKLSALSGILYGGLFFLGLFALGREFAAASLFSSFFFPVVLGFFETMPLASLFLQDRTVAALFAALVCGSGVGLIIRAGGSSGGMDIPPCVLWKYRGIPVGTSMFFFDAAILAAQMCFQGPAELLYSLIIMGGTGYVVNRTMLWGDDKIQITVVSEKWEEIRDLILYRADCGVSLLHLDGGFTGRRQRAVMSVVYAKKYPKIKSLVLEADPEAFVIASAVMGVNGQGYTLARRSGIKPAGDSGRIS